MTDPKSTHENGRALHRHSSTVEAIPVAAGTSTDVRVLIGPNDVGGGGNETGFAMRKFTMGPSGGMPRHTNLVEHEQYVLRGRARVEIGGELFEVAPDDVLFIPAGAPHSYQVIEAPFEFLCMVPNRPDRIEIVGDT